MAKRSFGARLSYWFWSTRLGVYSAERMSERCQDCPLCRSDYSDWHDFGLVYSDCSLHKGNEAEGCLTPGILIRLIAWSRARADKKALKAEVEYEIRMIQEEDEYLKSLEEDK